MKPVTWTWSAHLPASPDAVYAWMSDLREDDHARPAFLRGAGRTSPPKRPATRKVIAREGNVLTVEDAWEGKRFRSTVTLDPAAREVRIEGVFGYRATWRATPEGEGTRVTCEGATGGRGLMGLFARLFAKAMLRETEADFRGHVADLQDSLGVAPAQPT